ncbi:MAG: PKD domain-containing protein [Saprospiraceae bacterium]|nr:PKD domain-containing protein [Saprospiraceae bacterium]
MDSYFTKVAYKGAFGTDNWTKCWCEFDPKNADYSKPINYTSNISDFTFTVTDNVVNFTAPTGTNYSYKWNFGNFKTSTEQNPKIAYSALGTYTVLLTVTNERGCSKTISKQVSITSGTKEIAINTDITTNTTWKNDKIYRLTGSACLYVRNNATLTIEPGTIIKGDPSALVITRGSKLIAQGTEKQPIVFTSAKAAGERVVGDWGGIALLGAAKVNCPGGQCLLEGGCDPTLSVYGGTDDNDNSGILTYVRIEYAGIAFQPNNELNSLTLAGVGKGTTLNHIQTSFGGDDAYEWFGGAVDSKYLIAYKTVDDMFDTDFGYTGRNQFSLGISDPQIADVSGSNGFEADNDAQGTLNTPISNGTFANTTIFGPKSDPSVSINTNFKRGAHLRRSTRQDHFNSVITGFPFGMRVESANTENAYLTQNELKIKGNLLAGVTKVLDSTSTNSSAVLAKLLVDGNNVYPNVSDMKFTNSSNSTPDMRPLATSPLLSFPNSQEVYTDAFFTKVNYIGAFDANTNWTNCWAEWNPQNAD